MSGLSSCFHYHAGVGLPRPLVYAAELVCLLIGAKGVVMLQYDTPSEHQWKFPAVHDLVGRFEIARALHPELDLHSKVNVYRTERSLLFYRAGAATHAAMLRPEGKAQALHVTPYVDAQSRREEGGVDDQRLMLDQVFNSWWNGHALGYPSFLVQSYCRDLGKDVATDVKEAEMNRAERLFNAHFEASGELRPRTVAIGNFPDILDAVMEASSSSLFLPTTSPSGKLGK